MKNLLLYSCLAVALLSCGRRTASEPQTAGDSLAFSYSTLLSVVEYDGYSVATIRNPWKPGKVLHQYVLVNRGERREERGERKEESAEAFPAGTSAPTSEGTPPPTSEGTPAPTPAVSTAGTVIEVPIRRAAVFTTVHCALLTELGLGDRIVGVADAKYIKIPYIHEQIRKGAVVDCGNGLNPIVEKIMDVKPEVIMLSPFENSGGYGKTEEIGIPLIECAEYMETSPLARAEWMRFYGLLFGVADKTDSLFQQVDSAYTALKQQAAKAGRGRSVIVDKVVGSVWYMPGGRSTIGQMLQDAGGDYPWADDDQSGSLALPFETVLERGGEADVWMLRYSSDHPWDYRELLSGHHGYSQLRAFRQKEVYGCNVEQSHFYEETPFHPDRLLNDFLQILHPDIIGLAPLRYYKKLKE